MFVRTFIQNVTPFIVLACFLYWSCGCKLVEFIQSGSACSSKSSCQVLTPFQARCAQLRKQATLKQASSIFSATLWTFLRNTDWQYLWMNTVALWQNQALGRVPTGTLPVERWPLFWKMNNFVSALTLWEVTLPASTPSHCEMHAGRVIKLL